MRAMMKGPSRVLRRALCLAASDRRLTARFGSGWSPAAARPGSPERLPEQREPGVGWTLEAVRAELLLRTKLSFRAH